MATTYLLIFEHRKNNRRAGKDIAVYGPYSKNTKMGNVDIKLVLEKFTSAEQLKPYINESDLENAEDWLKLAQKMSDETLNRYYAKLF
jgi:hypothetical protein